MDEDGLFRIIDAASRLIRRSSQRARLLSRVILLYRFKESFSRTLGGDLPFFSLAVKQARLGVENDE